VTPATDDCASCSYWDVFKDLDDDCQPSPALSSSETNNNTKNHVRESYRTLFFFGVI